MSYRAILLSALILSVSFGGAAAPEPRIFAVLQEFDRMAGRPLWPGFEPARIPLEVQDGGRSWLVRHPRPPAEFAAVPGHDGVLVFEGRHESLRANTSVELNGVATATASFSERVGDPRRLAALLLHEAFHVFEARRHPSWGGNEAELFVYPVEDSENLALRRLESRALVRAFEAGSLEKTARWAALAVALRRARFERLPAASAAYERGTESKEGLARYIEAAAAGPRVPLIPEAEFGVAEVRDRAYESGCAIALVLDRLDPGWKRALEEKDAALDELLGRAVVKASAADFSPDERDAAHRRAAEDVAAWARSRSALRRELLGSPGWTLVVLSDAPLFPQAFDPLNVERLSMTEILHTRWVKLGNADGAVEVLDRRCLTESAGKHPLFEGVRRAVIAGLAEEPRLEEGNGGVRLSGQGVTLEFRTARVVRAGKTVTVSVGGGILPAR